MQAELIGEQEPAGVPIKAMKNGDLAVILKPNTANTWKRGMILYCPPSDNEKTVVCFATSSYVTRDDSYSEIRVRILAKGEKVELTV